MEFWACSLNTILPCAGVFKRSLRTTVMWLPEMCVHNRKLGSRKWISGRANFNFSQWTRVDDRRFELIVKNGTRHEKNVPRNLRSKKRLTGRDFMCDVKGLRRRLFRFVTPTLWTLVCAIDLFVEIAWFLGPVLTLPNGANEKVAISVFPYCLCNHI